jgi:excisionase family DNA binding protein
MRELLTISEAAAMVGVTKQAIDAAIKSGRLETVTVRVAATRIDKATLDNFKINPNMKRAGRPKKQIS